ncbi:MAG: CoA transferase [Deltaproteobacteria bacterium]|jgi:crotonobetainyl-CoA:carnitine CoA-transferase CaiB-like acyl-CoA transferase|nr:CoA transferase [Deltaproteobacteria bacterium]
MSKPGSLSGITVIDLSRLLPGPYCSMILADHGARVIAVEDKRFLADGLFFNLINRNKEHMSLNLKTDQGREIFSRLLEKADVLMEGFRPGVVDRLGVDYKTVSGVNPKIIYCAITGYGQNGPFRDRVGHDVNYLSYAGVLDLIGEKDRPPSIPGVQIADIAGGGMNAAIGILLALFARQQTGRGQYIDVSMTDGMVGFLPAALFFRQLTGQEPRRADGLLSHRYACYNTYETADGRYLSIGAVENRFWMQLCDTLEVPEYGPLQYDDQRREEILQYMRATFKQKTLDEWDAILADLDICWGKIQSTREVLEDPLFRQREMVVEIEGKDGQKSSTLGVAVKLSDTPGAIRTAPVNFGESTTAVLQELGYSQEEIKNFEDNDVI